MERKRAVLYARVSSRQQLTNTSIDTQIQAMEAYAREHDYKIVERVKVAHSGGYSDLPGMERLREIGRNGKADVVLVYRVDRFLRGDDADTDPGIDAAITERELNRLGLEVEYLDLPDKDSDAYVWAKTIKRIVGSVERREIALRMAGGRRKRAREGRPIVHGRPPYGYQLAEVDGKRTLIVDDTQAAVVRMIFDWYANGDDGAGPLSLAAIANRLTDMGIPTMGDIDDRIRKDNGRGVWNRTTVRNMLRRGAYAGDFYYGKANRRRRGPDVKNPRESWIRVSVDPIVSREIWQAAQDRLERNRHRTVKQTGYNYLLRQRVTCGECQSSMVAKVVKPRDIPYLYYQCPCATGRLDYARECGQTKWFRADQTDAAVWAWIADFLSDPATLAEGLRAAQQRKREDNKPLADRLGVVNDLLAKNRGKLNRLIDLYLDGDFERDVLVERQTRLERTIDKLEREQVALSTQLDAQTLTDDQIADVTDFARRVGEGLEVASTDFGARRHIVNLLEAEATLTIENGQRIAYARCLLGDRRLSASATTM
jgi:site-specific DNA recombinase